MEPRFFVLNHLLAFGLVACIGAGCSSVGDDDDSGVCCDDPEPAPEVKEVLVEASELVVCADPNARTLGPMYAAQAGPDFVEQQGWTPTAEDLPSGLAVADFDGDGRWDILWPTGLFLSQEDGTLSNVTTSHLVDFDYDIEGLSVADYDADGDMDVLATGFTGFRLLNNDGGAVFTDVTVAAGLEAAPLNTGTSAWADYDLDGDLDLAVMVLESADPDGESLESIINGTMPPGLESRLYENRGDGSFVFRDDLLPIEANQGYTCAGGWHDVDGDGRLDLYLVNDFGPQVQGNRLLRNTEEGFVDISESLALDVEIYGMGLAMGDVNGDRVPDFLAASWEDLAFLESAPDGTWYRSELARGLELKDTQHAAWGVHLVDMDNDTDLDALVAFGNLPDHGEEESQQIEDGLGLINTAGQPDALYIQRADGGFFDSASSWNLDDDRDGYSILPVDLNGDGWLDTVKSDRIWLSRCGEESWIRVGLWGPSPNHFAIGARVTVESAGITLDRWVVSGSTGHGSSMPPEVHFGLGSIERVERLSVTWPDGTVSSVEDVEARRILRLVREDATMTPPPLPIPSLQ